MAQAFFDAGFNNVRVFTSFATLDGVEVSLPKAATDIVMSFDRSPRTGEVPTFPITFELEV